MKWANKVFFCWVKKNWFLKQLRKFASYEERSTVLVLPSVKTFIWEDKIVAISPTLRIEYFPVYAVIKHLWERYSTIHAITIKTFWFSKKCNLFVDFIFIEWIVRELLRTWFSTIISNNVRCGYQKYNIFIIIFSSNSNTAKRLNFMFVT